MTSASSPPDHLQFVHAQRRGAVEIDGVRHPAYRQILNVRRLRSQNPDDLKRLPLVFQRLNVVGKRQQIHFRRQLHRRMSPVAVRENSQLSAARHRIHAILCGFQFVARIARPRRKALGQLRSRRRIGLRNLQHIHPIQRRQLIEMDDVIVQRVRNQNQIADVLRVQRNLQLQRVFHRSNAGHRVNRSADSAKALGKEPCIPRIAATQNLFDAAPHGARSPRVGDRVIVDLHVDAEVSFDSGDGINRDSFRHRILLLFGT